MSRVLAIDFGLKRCGLAVTDEMRILAMPLMTVPSHELLMFLQQYFSQENVQTLVLGYPTRTNGEDGHVTEHVRKLAETLRQKFADKELHLVDERFTSRLAQQTLALGGMKKKDRQNKNNVDKVSAALILQTFLEQPPKILGLSNI